MLNHNGLIDIISDKVEQILLLEPGGVSEYVLIKRLELKGSLHQYNFKHLRNFKNKEKSSTENLFVKHFFVTHILYRLKDEYEKIEGWELDINPINIRLRIPGDEHSEANYSKNVKLSLDLNGSYEANERLKAYYADWDNINRSDPDELLARFWSSYSKHEKNKFKKPVTDDARECFYRKLGLEPTPKKPHDLSVIRNSYRSLIRQAHPDFGGSAEKFIHIRQAYERLKAEFE